MTLHELAIRLSPFKGALNSNKIQLLKKACILLIDPKYEAMHAI